MTRSEVKALQRLVEAEEGLQGYIDRLSIDKADGADAARIEPQTQHHHEWNNHDYFVVLPIDVAMEMARVGLMAVRDQLQAAQVTE